MSLTLILSALKGSMGTIITYWKEILIILLILLVLYQNTSSVRYLFFIETIPSLQRRLELITENLDICTKGNEVLSKIIEDRNNEVLKWQQISNNLKDKTKKLNAKLYNMRKLTNKKIKRIVNDKTPANCKESIQYLRNGIDELKWTK